MKSASDSHTVLWVPRYWPAVGGTEFHSRELAQNLVQHQSVSVVSHCTRTEDLHLSLAKAAAVAEPTKKWDHDVCTTTLAPNPQWSWLLKALGHQRARSKVASRLFHLCFYKAFRASAEAALADADRIHFIYNGLTEAACLAALIAKQRNIPFVFTPNILDTSDQGSAWDSPSFHWLYGKADAIIALTSHEANWLSGHGVDASKISVVPYAPILENRNAQEEQGQHSHLLSEKFILFLGRLVPEKGYMSLLAAFNLLKETDDDTQLVVVIPAEGSSSAFKDEMAELRRHQRVHLIQDVSQPMKRALLEEASVLCVPSRRESLGGVYIEAMACGTPVIALDRPVSRCVIQSEVDGLLVDDSPEAISRGLQRVLSNGALAARLVEEGYSTVQERFTWQKVTQQVMTVYDGCSEEAPVCHRRAA